MSAEGSGARLAPAVYCRCPDNCLHASDCAVHNEPADEAGNCTCMTPAQKRALPDAHYSDGRRYSHIGKAWIFAEDWNDREEAARLNAVLAALTARVAQLEEALRMLIAANEKRGIDALLDVAAALPQVRAALRSTTRGTEEDSDVRRGAK